MRLVRSFIALAVLSAAACAESGITAPESASRNATGGWIDSGNLTAAPDDADGGTGNATNADGGNWGGSGNVIAPGDTTKDGRGGNWGGSGN